MDDDDFIETPQNKPCIPGVTDNKQGMKKLIGLIFLTGVLNQRKFTFDFFNEKAFNLYFSSSPEKYDPREVHRWWFPLESLTIIFSILFIKKIKPVFFYGIITLIVGAGQFTIAFFEQHKLEAYGTTMGITGGIGAGSTFILPFFILCSVFKAKYKAIVTAIYLMCQALFHEVLMFQGLRGLWWASTEIPSSVEDMER